jgi:hypothetical protein
MDSEKRVLTIFGSERGLMGSWIKQHESSSIILIIHKISV